jgi:hypothetical protein
MSDMERAQERELKLGSAVTIPRHFRLGSVPLIRFDRETRRERTCPCLSKGNDDDTFPFNFSLYRPIKREGRPETDRKPFFDPHWLKFGRSRIAAAPAVYRHMVSREPSHARSLSLAQYQRLFSFGCFQHGGTVTAPSAIISAPTLSSSQCSCSWPFWSLPDRLTLTRQMDAQSPVKAVDLIKTNHLPGRMLNDYAFG